jgi:hypothetical protein
MRAATKIQIRGTPFDPAQRRLPVGMRQIGTTGKIPLHADPKSLAKCGRPVPARGAVARRHERGTGCGGRENVGTPWMSQRGLNLVSDGKARRTNDV